MNKFTNPLDNSLMLPLGDAATALASDASVRAVVLTGAGAAFCAGADLAWMRRMREHDEQRNLDDALTVAELFHALADHDYRVFSLAGYGPWIGAPSETGVAPPRELTPPDMSAHKHFDLLGIPSENVKDGR